MATGLRVGRPEDSGSIPGNYSRRALWRTQISVQLVPRANKPGQVDRWPLSSAEVKTDQAMAPLRHTSPLHGEVEVKLFLCLTD
jgi:hypothetical protein